MLISIAFAQHQYQQYLTNEDNIDNWFLPLLVEKLLSAGKILRINEVYNFTKPAVIGGQYSVDNILPTDMSVHFAFNEQISEQIKDSALRSLQTS